MALNTSYSSINILGDFSMIAGGTFILKFAVFDQDSIAVDLTATGTICKWRMSPYGTDFTVLEKTGVIIASNIFQINLAADDTDGLSGKYAHQPSVNFVGGARIIPAQGIITIIRGLESPEG